MSQLEINSRVYSDDAKSIDKLFKAIYLIQELPNCGDELASLTKKIEEEFEDIKDKGGVKTWGGNYKYWPNGLCEMTRHTSIKIVLSPWDNKTKFKEKSDLNDYKILRDMNDTWSRQLRQLLGRKYQVPERNRIPAAKLWENIQKIKSLSEEEKKFIDMSKINKEKKSIAYDLVRWLTRMDLTRLNERHSYSNYQGDRIATFLSSDELLQVKELLDKNHNDYWLKHELEDMLAKMGKKKDISGRVTISFTEIKRDRNGDFSNPEEAFDILYPKILQITDENVKAVLKKMELI